MAWHDVMFHGGMKRPGEIGQMKMTLNSIWLCDVGDRGSNKAKARLVWQRCLGSNYNNINYSYIMVVINGHLSYRYTHHMYRYATCMSRRLASTLRRTLLVRATSVMYRKCVRHMVLLVSPVQAIDNWLVLTDDLLIIITILHSVIEFTCLVTTAGDSREVGLHRICY